jgi:hypothetical protein
MVRPVQRMTAQRRPRPVRAVPDPKPRPTGFWPVELVVTLGGEFARLALCGSCSALIPGTDKAQAQHRSLHEAVEAALPR